MDLGTEAKNIANHATFASTKLESIFGQIELPTRQKLNFVIKVLVSSFLNFGGKVIGSYMYPCPNLELIHAKFLRRIQ